MQPDASGPTGADLRRALSHFATGVAVVATRDPEGRPVGLTINSFTSVSLDPPLIAWSLISRSRYLPAFRAADHFSVNILSAHQRDLSHRFAQPQEDRFAGVALQPSWSGVPILADVIAVFECHTHDVFEAGDHHMILGRVADVRYSDEPPLVYCKGAMQAWPSACPA